DPGPDDPLHRDGPRRKRPDPARRHAPLTGPARSRPTRAVATQVRVADDVAAPLVEVALPDHEADARRPPRFVRWRRAVVDDADRSAGEVEAVVLARQTERECEPGRARAEVTVRPRGRPAGAHGLDSRDWRARA